MYCSLCTLTDYHPCNGKTCPFYGVCNATSPSTYKCVCEPCTTDESSPLCDNKDVTHKNKCEYNYAVCMAREEPGIKHDGGCKRKSCYCEGRFTFATFSHMTGLRHDLQPFTHASVCRNNVTASSTGRHCNCTREPSVSHAIILDI